MTDFAAIFDMDGVLIDSYHAHYESWLEMAREEGLSLTEATFRETFGRTSREVIATVWGAARQFSEAEIAALDWRKEEAFRRIIQRRMPVMPGAVELLRDLSKAGFRLAVGSSAPPENVDAILDGMHLRDRFAAAVTGADVTRGKPDPEVFLTAARRLGVSPGRCVVIEDAPVGIAAATAAGMACVGLASTGRTRELLARASLVVDSLSELSPEVLRKLIG